MNRRPILQPKRRRQKNKGFIKTIILIIVALAILKYVFDIDVKDMIESATFQSILEIGKNLLSLMWDAALASIEFLKVAFEFSKNFVRELIKK